MLHLANGYMFDPSSCTDENLKYLVDRLQEDIISIFKDLEVDRIELALLKAIILFDPGKKMFVFCFTVMNFRFSLFFNFKRRKI